MSPLTDESEVPLNRGRQAEITPRREENVSGRDMSSATLSAKSEGWRMVEIFFAEFTGTGILLLLGCMSQIVWSESEMLDPWQGSIVFAVVVTTCISVFGHITAAHLNPAVTLCFLLLGQITYLEAIVYVVAEICGAIAGFGMLKVITPCDIFELSMQYSGGKVCVNYPHGSMSNSQALIAEFFATSVLILVVCSCSDERNAKNSDSVALKFGATILALCIAEGPYTGAGMNPARSLAPVVWNKTWDKHWIFWLGPLSGALCATIFYIKLFGTKRTPNAERNSQSDGTLRSVNSH